MFYESIESNKVVSRTEHRLYFDNDGALIQYLGPDKKPVPLQSEEAREMASNRKHLFEINRRVLGMSGKEVEWDDAKMDQITPAKLAGK